MRTHTRPLGRSCITLYIGSHLAAAALLDTAIAGEADSSIVFDNLTINGGLDSAGASPASQIDSLFAFDAGAADDFVLPESPRCRWAVTGVRWTGLRWGGSSPGLITGFRIVFWPDEDGIPRGGGGLVPDLGSALAAYDVAGDAGETALGGDAYQYEAALPQALELLHGTRYWIQIQAKIAFPPQWGLHITHGRQGMPPVSYFDLLELAAWTAVPDDGDLAFQLLGVPVDIACDDGNACTADACVSGVCASSPIHCDDGNACTSDSCDVELGCQTTGIVCDDQDPCTVDSCDPQTGCSSSAMSCADDDPCTVDLCETGICEHFSPPDLDGDGDTDLKDFEIVSACFDLGPGTGTLGCECVDLNGDGRLDLIDFAAFQRLYTGSR